MISFLLFLNVNLKMNARNYKVSDVIIKPTDFVIDDYGKLYLYDEAKLELNKIDIKENKVLYSTKIDFKDIESFLIKNDYINKKYKCYNNQENNFCKLINLDYIRNKGVSEQVIKVEAERELKNLFIENNKIYSSGLVYLNFECTDKWTMIPDLFTFSIKNEKLEPIYIPAKKDIRKYLGKSSCLKNNTFYYINTFLNDNKSFDKLLFKYESGEFSYLPTLKNYSLDLKSFDKHFLVLQYYKDKLLICERNGNRIYDVFDDKLHLSLGDSELFYSDTNQRIIVYDYDKVKIRNESYTSNDNYLFIHQWKKVNGKRISYLKVIYKDKILSNLNFIKINPEILGVASIFAKKDKLYYLYLDKNEDYYIDDVDINKLLKL